MVHWVIQMLVKEVMTKKVITIDKNKTVFEASNMYKDYKIGCLIVTDNGNCVGIITERDIIERTICARRDAEKTKVEEIMSSDIKTVHALGKLEDAIKIMMEYNIKKLPVLKDGHIVGIITGTDISKSRPDISKRFMESWIKPEWHD